MADLQMEIINLLILVFAGVFGVVTKCVTSYLNKKGVVATLQSNKEIVKIVVNAIEQTYSELNGKEKLNLAKAEIVKIAQSKGIKITEKELDLLIEHSVKEMNNGIKNGIKDSK